MLRIRSMVAPALLAALWAGLNGLDARSWLVGLPIVILAALVSWTLAPERGPALRWGALPGFLLYFVWESVRGGVDVARRAFRPGPSLDPGVVTFATRLPPGPARTLFAGAIGLLPGTLVLAMTDEAFEVHALDASADVGGELRTLEDRIARLFGLPPETIGDAPGATPPDADAPTGRAPGAANPPGEAPSGGLS